LKRILTFTAIFIFTAASAHAGLVETFGIGAKETAQGKAVAAQADTPFAVYYNPAGLTQIEGPTLSAGATVYDATVSSDNFRLKDGNGDPIPNPGWDTDNETDNDPLVNPAMGYAMPVTDKISFGIAAYSPYGLHIKSNKNPYENPISFYAWESMYVRTAVTPTIAYKLNDKISVGFGVSLGQSETEAGKTYRYNPFASAAASDPDNINMLSTAIGSVAAAVPGGADASETAVITQEVAGAAILSTDSANGDLNDLKLEAKDDFNASWNAGIMYKASDKLSMGLTYRSRTDADFKGDVFFKGVNIGSVTMDYDHPDQVQGGVRYAFTDSFSVEFDLTWTHWSINKEQVEPMNLNKLSSLTDDATNALAAGINANTKLSSAEKEAIITALASQDLSADPTTKVAAHERDWENTLQYQLGAEWLLNEKLALRGGIIYDPTPVPDHTFDQGWPDTDRTVFNIGAGYKITDQWEIDTVFQFITSTPPRDIEGDSDELNHTFSEEVIGQDVGVYMDDNKGVLYGFGATVTYRF